MLGDGRTVTLVVDFEALAQAEDAADLPVGDILQSLTSRPRMKVLRAVVFGALHEKHPEIGLAEVGDLLLSSDAAVLTDALGKAVSGAFPQASQAGAANPPKPPRGAGMNSRATGRRKG